MSLFRGGICGWRSAVAVGGMALLAAAVLLVSQRSDAMAQAHTIEQAFPHGLRDLSLTARRVQVNISELNKISRDFANAYRVGDSRIRLKEPGKFRMDARVGPLRFEYIINGGRRVTRAPLVNERRDIGDDPGKRQGPLDVGLVTSGALVGYLVEHLGCGQEGGRPVCQYRLRYAHIPERHELLWVDTERNHVVRRRLYTNEGGKLRMEFLFLEPTRVGSFWVPTRIEVRNAQARLAGVTRQSDIQVNRGLEDALFTL